MKNDFISKFLASRRKNKYTIFSKNRAQNFKNARKNNIFANYTIDSSWNSASSLHNYILNDPLVDYLKYGKQKYGQYAQSTQNAQYAQNGQNAPEEFSLRTQGINFENRIIELLRAQFPQLNIPTYCM